jgi:hypothetical protein
VAASGVEHVYLSYHYLECDDIDGYSSLLNDDVVLHRPDTPPAHGRAEVVQMLLDGVIPRARHSIDQVISNDDHVVVLGSLIQDAGPSTPTVERTLFTDVFLLSEIGMLRSCRRYYCSPPAEGFRVAA